MPRPVPPPDRYMITYILAYTHSTIHACIHTLEPCRPLFVSSCSCVGVWRGFGVWHGLTQAWLVPKQGPTRPGSVSLPTDLTRRRRRLRIVAVVEQAFGSRFAPRVRPRDRLCRHGPLSRVRYRPWRLVLRLQDRKSMRTGTSPVRQQPAAPWWTSGRSLPNQWLDGTTTSIPGPSRLRRGHSSPRHGPNQVRVGMTGVVSGTARITSCQVHRALPQADPAATYD